MTSQGGTLLMSNGSTSPSTTSKADKKILLLEYNSKATEKASDIFQDCKITIAESLKDVVEKAEDNYDLIITGYIVPAVPAVSGDNLISSLLDIDTSIKELESAIKGEKEQIEKQSQEKHEQILTFLNEHIKGFEKEKADHEETLGKMETKITEALRIKEEAEKNTENALNEKKEAEEKIGLVLQEKNEAEEQAEAALKEKTKIIDELNNKLQNINDEVDANKTSVEQIQAEKEIVESQLKKLQEAWERL